jgi:hypothetical protein
VAKVGLGSSRRPDDHHGAAASPHKAEVTSGLGQSTKSLRSSPLHGALNREAGMIDGTAMTGGKINVAFAASRCPTHRGFVPCAFRTPATSRVWIGLHAGIRKTCTQPASRSAASNCRSR